jgi:hypothetical protein
MSVLLNKKISRTIPSNGDLYIKGFSVYRVMVYDNSDDTVLLATTNDVIAFFGRVRRLRLRNQGFYLCPLQLREPAIELFELHEELDKNSIKKLQDFRQQYIHTYEKLGLLDLLEDIDEAKVRVYQIPMEQGSQFPDLSGKSFNLPIPFYCLTKEVYKKRYNHRNPKPTEEYFGAMHYTKWPVFYVPRRFDK